MTVSFGLIYLLPEIEIIIIKEKKIPGDFAFRTWNKTYHFDDAFLIVVT